MLLIFLGFVLSYYVSLRSEVPCCDVRYDFRIKKMFGSSLHPVVCRRAHVLFTLCLFVHGGVQHTLCCVFVLFYFVLCTLCWQVFFLVCPFLIAPSVFSNVYLINSSLLYVICQKMTRKDREMTREIDFVTQSHSLWGQPIYEEYIYLTIRSHSF